MRGTGVFRIGIAVSSRRHDGYIFADCVGNRIIHVTAVSAAETEVDDVRAVICRIADAFADD